MPKTLLDFLGYCFFFYSNENDEPIHVHVSKGKPSENNAKFWIKGEDDVFVTSTITDSEYLVFPFRNNDSQKILAYESFLKDFNFRLLEPNRNITKKAPK